MNVELAYSASQVAEKYNYFKDLIDNFNTTYSTGIFNRLNKILEMLDTKERDFYSLLSEYNPHATIRNLQEAQQFLDHMAQTEFAFINFVIAKAIYTKPEEDQINLRQKELVSAIQKEASNSQQLTDEIYGYAFDVITNPKFNPFSRASANTTHVDLSDIKMSNQIEKFKDLQKALNGTLNINLDFSRKSNTRKKNQVHVVISKKGLDPMTSQELDTIKEFFRSRVQKGELLNEKTEQGVGRVALWASIRNKIKELSAGYDTNAVKTFLKILPKEDATEEELKNQYGIDINASSASIKGALGELYWLAFFKSLKMDVIPTGAIKNIENGQSLPVDLVINHRFGIQVKNYRIKYDEVTFKNSPMNADTYIEQVFGASRRMTVAAENYLIAGVFNKKITAKDITDLYTKGRGDPELNSWVSWFEDHPGSQVDYGKNIYTPLYGGSNSDNQTNILLSKASNYFIDKLLTIENSFQTEFNRIVNIDNVFYLIGDYLIPTSSIIKAIIDGFDKDVSRYMIARTSLNPATTATSKKTDKPWSPVRVKENDLYSPRQYLLQAGKIASRITMNLDLLLKETVKRHEGLHRTQRHQ